MADSREFDVLIVGAGPAGLAAAAAAAGSNASIGLIDDNAHPGGQIYRASGGKPHSEVGPQIQSLRSKGVTIIDGTTVVDAPQPGALTGLSEGRAISLKYRRLILCVGARELFIPFPGWTLPNVMGVGGLQALVKAGLDVHGKRVVVSGSGPLLLAVAAYLRQHGALVVTIAEQASMFRLAAFTAFLGGYPSKISQGAALIGQARAVPRSGRWVEEAEGMGKLEAVRLNKTTKSIPCDYLACAYGFVPNLELPRLLGCSVRDVVLCTELQQTSIDGIYCAGEPCGIGGIDRATIEGKIAGYAATDQTERAKALFPERRHWRKFAGVMAWAFGLRDEIKALPTADTVVCRCEDVKLRQLVESESGRAAKLHTRCGMGPCQGRICGSATHFLFGWEHGTVRPPLVPTPLGCLETSCLDTEPAHSSDQSN